MIFTKRHLFFTVLTAFAFGAVSCTTVESPKTNSADANVLTNVNAADLPPGFSVKPVPMSANATPGIPNPNDAAANKMPTGNIPGIPDTSKPGATPQPRNTPPIPGIPDQETIKKQMNTPLKDVNVVNNPTKTSSNANNQPANNSRQP